ncbi:hydantoinase/oxoprolinase family protein [SAR202 cluster bacterium AD-804-J14_MRT_500m]|nr:hydantoinase/oxoprolinase family protein [SAR202 cluster bacterium AD-804-J14_MRT_500m]
MTRFRVGVDIGGTFTDVVFLGDDGTVLARKIASTPDDYSRAVLKGVKEGESELNIGSEQIEEVSHGFTVATNAIIEGKGARTALITTEGFRDILEFRRNRVPRLYDLYYEKAPPLVKRQFRLEVKERVNFKGEIIKALDKNGVESVVTNILNSQVESVAVCLLHSYANPDHEHYIGEVLKRRAPNIVLTLSSELLPEMKEYERTSTTVINCYVRPVVERYLTALIDGLKGMSINVPLTVMQSNGGLATARIAQEKPVYCIESGPAAGVVGANHLGKRLGIENLMTLDMGGTTAKASIIENGEMLQAPEYEVGGGISVGHRLLKGAGHILRVAAIDLAEVGAGGGSIASVDGSGSLRVGPNSSGAQPGPACYSQGGTDATVTDADVLLGYLNPCFLLGGDFPIDADKARKAISQDVAGPLEMSEIEAAHGVHLLVNSNMSRALRAVSSERGRDPRRFTLMAFGGGGPVHAAGLAEMLDIKKVIIPPYPGVFSSFGLLFADVEHHFIKTYFKTFDEMQIDELNVILNNMVEEGRVQLRSEGFEDSRHQTTIQVDMKYNGQVSELTVPMPAGPVTSHTLTNLVEAFEVEHEKTYGYRTNVGFQMVNLRVIARGLSEENRLPEQYQMASVSGHSGGNRQIYFGPKIGWVNTPITTRQGLVGGIDGPVIVEEYDSTTVVPPGWHSSVDRWQNVILER